MSWSYRRDSSDELYNATPGPAIVPGSQQASTPGDAGSSVAAADAVKSNVGANPINVYSADGAITVAPQRAVMTKGSAAAMTLAAPTAAQAGTTIQLIAGSAFAHVITATGLIDDGVTGGAKNTVTLGAFVGATATLMAYNLHWVLLSKTVATVA